MITIGWGGGDDVVVRFVVVFERITDFSMLLLKRIITFMLPVLNYNVIRMK